MTVNDATVEEIITGYGSLYGEGGSAVIERDVISVVGPDAGRYLQGQLSQDVVAMSAHSAWSFLLAPTGRVEAWLRVHRIDDEDYLLEVDAGWGDAVLTRLKRFLLRTKADISEPQRRALVQRRWSPDLVRIGQEGPEGAIVAPAIGPHVAGADVLLRMGAGAAAKFAVADLVPVESLERHRIAHGVPRMGAELTDETIPGEAGQWVIDASVSFTKGCYTGQELVARIDSRGNNVPHPIRLLSVVGDVAVGDVVRLDGAEVGAITSSTPSLGDGLPCLALARVGRAVEVGSVVVVGTGMSATAIEPGSVR